MPAVVLTEVHRYLGVPLRCAKQLVPHEEIAGQVEAELGGDPGERQDEHNDGEDHSHEIAGEPRLERATRATPRGNRQPESERDADAGDEVLPARVEVRLA